MIRYTRNKLFRDFGFIPMKMLFALYVMILVCPHPTFGQSTLPEIDENGNLVFSDEDSPALFDYQIGDSQVDLFILGNWDAQIGLAAGMTWVPQSGGGYRSVAGAPGDLTTTALTNTVDLVISLWLNEQFFFESSFQSGFTDNSILAGYYGEGTLRQFKIGNTDIGIGDYEGIEISEGITGSPGLSAVFAGPSSMHELMLRYETTSQVTRTFVGESEYDSNRVEIGDYISGKYFLLPDRDVDSITVYLQSERSERDFGDRSLQDTDGTWYRRLIQSEEYGLDNDNGILTLLSTLPEARVLVYYEKDGASVGDASLGEIPIVDLQAVVDSGSYGVSTSTVAYDASTFEADFVTPLIALLGLESDALGASDFHKVISGDTTLVLYEPGNFSPFEIQAYYSGSVGDGQVMLIRSTGESASISFEDTSGGVRLYPQSSYSVTSTPWKLRYPLMDRYEDGGQMYGPGSPGAANVYDEQIAFWLEKIGVTSTGYSLDDDIIPGSLRVYRNGGLTQDYQVENGTVSFFDDPDDLDQVTLSYRILDDSGQSGNLVAATGNRFDLGGGNSISAALAGSIAVAAEEASEIPGNNPGYVELSTGFEHKSEQLDFSVNLIGGLYAADTRSEYRPSDDDLDDWAPAMAALLLRPSGLPDEDLLVAEGLTGVTTGDIDYDTRGTLAFRNLRSTTRGTLLSRDSYSSLPDVLDEVSGPYPVLADDDDVPEGVLADMEFEMSTAGWVGYQYVPASDLPGLLKGFRIYYLTQDFSPSGNVYLILQFGDIGEDIDGDNVLDEQESPDDYGFEFNSANGDLLAGYPGLEYSSDWSGVSEDADDDGVLESDNHAGMVTKIYSTPLSSSSGWQSFSANFSSQELSRFSEDFGVRVILYSDDAASGDILFSRSEFTRSTISVQGTDAVISDASSSSGADYRIEWDPSDVAEIFLNLGGAAWGIYRNITIPMNALDEGNGDDNFDLYINGQYAASLNLTEADRLVNLVIDFEKMTASIEDEDGNELSLSALSSELETQDLRFLSLSFAGSNSVSGDLLIGDAVFTDPDIYVAGAVQSAVDYRPLNWVLAAGSPWETRLERLQGETSLASGALELARGIDTSISATGKVPFSDLELISRVYWDYESEVDSQLGYSYRLRPDDSFELQSDYQYYWGPDFDGVQLSNQLGVDIVPARAFELRANWEVSEGATLRSRGWTAENRIDIGQNPDQNDNPLRLGLGMDIDLELDEEISSAQNFHSDEQYSAMGHWADSYSLMDWANTDGSDHSRTGELSIRANPANNYLSASLSAQVESTYASLPSSRYSSGFDQSLSLSVSPNDYFEISLAFEQDYLVKDMSWSSGFGDDLSQSMQRLESLWPISAPRYLSPVSGDHAAEDFFETMENNNALDSPYYGELSNDIRLTASRRTGAHVRDLLIPSSAKLIISRDIEWDGGIEDDERLLTNLLVWQAQNLFGRLGEYRRFNWYDSEEWYAQTSYKQDLDDSQHWLISTSAEPTFFTSQGLIESHEYTLLFSYANQGMSSWTAQFTGEINWNTPLESGSALTNFLREHSSLPAELGLEHTEGLTLGFTAFRKDYETSSLDIDENPGFNIEMFHSSGLRFSELGKLSLEITMLYENEVVEELSYRYSHAIGFQVDAILELSY